MGAVVIDGEAAGLRGVTERRRMGAAFVPGGTARPRHRAADEIVRERSAHWPCRERHGQSRASSTSRQRLLRLTAPRRASTCARQSAIPRPSSLSGGNLQKFIVGREILREPGVLVVSQPTWGVDAGAAATIRQALIDLAGRGTAILVISQDLDELAEIADRIAVMFHGQLSKPLSAAEATRETLGLLMGGASTGRAGIQEAGDAVGS